VALPAPHPKPAKTAKAQPVPAPPDAYKVEVIRGNKVDETKFPDQTGAH
jgi:hypothetical protein